MAASKLQFPTKQYKNPAQYLLKSRIDQLVNEVFEPSTPTGTIVNQFSYTDISGTTTYKEIPNDFIENMKNFFRKRLKKYIPEKAKVFIAAGSVASYLLHQSNFFINDFDLFPCSREDFDLIWNHLNREVLIGDFTTVDGPNATHFDNDNISIDVIKRYENNATDVIKKFDMNICKFSLSFHENYAFSKECNWEDLYNLKLRYDFDRIGSKEYKNPLLELIRINKYILKGFKMDAGHFAHVFVRMTRPDLLSEDKKETANRVGDEIEKIVGEYGFQSLYENGLY